MSVKKTTAIILTLSSIFTTPYFSFAAEKDGGALKTQLQATGIFPTLNLLQDKKIVLRLNDVVKDKTPLQIDELIKFFKTFIEAQGGKLLVLDKGLSEKQVRELSNTAKEMTPVLANVLEAYGFIPDLVLGINGADAQADNTTTANVNLAGTNGGEDDFSNLLLTQLLQVGAKALMPGLAGEKAYQQNPDNGLSAIATPLMEAGVPFAMLDLDKTTNETDQRMQQAMLALALSNAVSKFFA